ncbi:MAG: macro domain-containing protein [Saprospiraceae bacterium]
MIQYITGNIFESEAEALVNTVNTVGVMGKGLALQFKKAYPSNYKAYHKACKNKEIEIGKLFIYKDSNLISGEKTIINFPTKKNWRKPSEYIYIEDGLKDLVTIIEENNIKSIAIPPLGAGNGGLNWEKVKQIIEENLKSLNVDVFIYEPNFQIREKLKKERVKLTNARALLLYLLFDLIRNGEYVSEFSSEKICYFLQKFGAEKYFKLEFTPNFYGPYSGKVRYVLNALNGSYLMGYSDMNKKPFDPLTLISDSYDNISIYIEEKKELLEIATQTKKFLNGFYSDFSLELLSTIDFIIEDKKTFDKSLITKELASWNKRKRSMFSDERYIDIALNHLKIIHNQKDNND